MNRDKLEFPNTTPYEELLDVAFDVVRRYKDFDAYGSEAKASQALKRRCPRYDPEQYVDAFQEAIQLFEAATEVVEANKDVLIKNWGCLHDIDHRQIDEGLRARCPAFRESTRNLALGWILYWHYLK